MVFQSINIRQVPWEVLKTAAFVPRDLANVKAWKTMFDPYIDGAKKSQRCLSIQIVKNIHVRQEPTCPYFFGCAKTVRTLRAFYFLHDNIKMNLTIGKNVTKSKN